MSRLIRIFTVCLVIFVFQYLKYETNKVAVCLSEYTRLYPTLNWSFFIDVRSYLTVFKRCFIWNEKKWIHFILHCQYCKFGNFRDAYAKFVKIKPSRIDDIILSFTDIGKSCPFRDFYDANVSFNAIRENKLLAKISEFTVFCPEIDVCQCTFPQLRILEYTSDYFWSGNPDQLATKGAVQSGPILFSIEAIKEDEREREREREKEKEKERESRRHKIRFSYKWGKNAPSCELSSVHKQRHA